MTHITQVLAVPAVGAYYHEDLAALQSRPIPMSERYTAAPVTPGFRRVRQPAEAVSVGLALDDGRVAWGDCVAVAYSGKAGRDAVFYAQDGLCAIQQTVAPALEGRPLTGFREMAEAVDRLTEWVEWTRPAPKPAGLSRRDLLTAPLRWWKSASGDPEEAPAPESVIVEQREQRLHTAVRYGVSQAILKAVALDRGVTMAEVIAQEWELPPPDAPIPIHAQSGGERRRNADKMIVRRAASLPHGLVDDVSRQLGEDGALLTRYVRWLKERIETLGGDGYCPTIHLDVHGGLGQICDHNLGKVLGQLQALELAAQPYPLRVESPVVMESCAAQIEAYRTLREYVRFHKMAVQLVADEWANTLEDVRAFVEAQAADIIQIKTPDLGSIHNTVDAVLACRAVGVGAFLGGSCCETDLSAKVTVHVALAVRPDILMAKPGMGVDEGMMLVQNEMARTLAHIRARTSAADESLTAH
jgi:methylaspartate ammonia-lyase